MFAKVAVLFFSFVVFVNAAPLVDYKTNPDVRPTKDGEHRILPVENAALKRGHSSDVSAHIDIPKKFVEPDWHLLPRIKREIVDLDALSNQILNGLKSNGLDEYVEHFSTRIQRLKDILASNASHDQVPAEAHNLLLEYRQVLAGLDANKPVNARDIGPSGARVGSLKNKRVEARGIVVDPQVLAQLQNFSDSTVNLLHALGKPDAVNKFLSKINNLKAEAQNGTLDAGDLLSAARDIIASVL